MDCADHVTSHALYVSFCECAASGKLRQFSRSSSSGIVPSSSQAVSPVGYGASDVTGALRLNSFGGDKSMMFKTYSDPLPIQLHGMNCLRAFFVAVI